MEQQQQQQDLTRSDGNTENQPWRTPNYVDYRQRLAERIPVPSQTQTQQHQDPQSQSADPTQQIHTQPYYSTIQDALYDVPVSSALVQPSAATMSLDPSLQYRHESAHSRFTSDPGPLLDARDPLAQYGQYQQTMEPLFQPFQAMPGAQYLGSSGPTVSQNTYLPVQRQQSFQFMTQPPQQQQQQQQQSHQQQQQREHQYQQQQQHRQEHPSSTSPGQGGYLRYQDASSAQAAYRGQQPVLQAQHTNNISTLPALPPTTSVLPEHSPDASYPWTFLSAGTYPPSVSTQAPQESVGQQNRDSAPDFPQGEPMAGTTTSATTTTASSAGDAQQAASHGPAKKRIAQSACETCRRKRTKCVIEAGHIGCNVCRSLHIPCIFSGIDKRKESVRVLRARLAQLETLVGRLMSGNQQEAQVVLSTLRSGEGGTIVPEDGNNLAASSAGAVPPRHDATRTTSSSSGTSESVRNRTAPSPTKTESRDSGLMITEEGTRSPVAHARRTQFGREQNTFRDDPSSRGLKRGIRELSSGGEHNAAKATEDTLAELTDRLTIDDGGNLRAVSAASSLAFEPSHTPNSNSSSTDQGANISENSMPTDEIDFSTNIIIGPGVELPEGTTHETVEHLLKLYFIWEMPLHPVVSRLAFLRDLAKGEGPYFSSLLLNSILAFACTLSDRSELRADQHDPHTSGEHFYVMADDMLTEEIDGAIGPIRLPITTVQAIVVLVSRLLATGNELKAWMFLSTCARMALDLGLHLDARAFLLKTDQQARSSKFTEDDLYVRARTFWGVWIFEQELCTIFGRPGILRDIVITCPYVETFDTRWSKSEDLDWWESAQTGRVVTLNANADPTDGVSHLWPIARKIANAFVHSMRLVYYDVAMSSSGQGEERQSALNHTMQKTRQLARILPPYPGVFETAPQQLQRPTSSFLLLYLHLLIRSHVILINRPFMSGSATHDTESNSPQSSPGEIGAAGDSPRIRCLRSAVDILSLLSKWRDTSPGGLRTINITTAHILMSAATVFLNEITSALSSSPSHASFENSGSSGPHRNNSARFPPMDDYDARQKYGKERLLQDIMPMLQEMAQYRPAAHHLAERLKKAISEREELVRQHEAKVRQSYGSRG